MNDAPFLFAERRPGPQLERFVEMLWTARGRIDYAADRILPNGRVVVLINLGSAFETTPACDPALAAVQTNAWVCGVQRAPMWNRPLAETHVLGVTFQPAGAQPLLGVPVHELTDRVVPLDVFWGAAFVRELRERLSEARGAGGRLLMLEQQLLRCSGDIDPSLRRAAHAADRLWRAPLPTVSIAREVALSSKHLISEFHRLIGITPRTLGRIGRLHRVLDHLDARECIDWAGLAYTHGFADQPHLIREFRALAGVTPVEYVSERQAVFGPELAPGENAIFVPVR